MANDLEIVLRIKTEGDKQLKALRGPFRDLSADVTSTGRVVEHLDSQTSKLAATMNQPLRGSVATLRSELAATKLGIADVSNEGGKLRTTVGNLSTSMLGLGRTALPSVADGFLTMAPAAAIAGASVASLFVGVGLASKAAVDFVRPYAAAAEETHRFAIRLGLGATEALRLREAAGLAEVSVGSLESVGKKLSDSLSSEGAEATKTRNALAALGVRTFDAAGEQRALGLTLGDTIAALSKVRNAKERDALASQLGAKELLPLIERYAELNKTVGDLGIGSDGNLVEANRKIREMDLAVQQLQKTAAIRIAPIVIEITRYVTDILKPGNGQPGPASLAASGGTNRNVKFVSEISPNLRLPTASDAATEIERLSSFSGLQVQIGDSTESGIRSRLEEARSDRSKVLAKINANAGDPTVLGAEFKRLDALEAALQVQLKAFDKRVRDTNSGFDALITSLNERKIDPLAGLITSTQDKLLAVVSKSGALTVAQQTAATEALFGKTERVAGPTLDGSSLFRSTPGAFQRIANDKPLELERASIAAQTFGFRSNQQSTARVVDLDPRVNDKQLEEITNRRLGALQRAANFEERIVELQAGPGGQLDAIERIASIRETAAEREFAITKDRAKYEAEVDEARKGRVIAIAELEARKIQENRDAAGKIFDALVSNGSTGLKDLALGQLKVAGRTVFQNASQLLGEGAGKLGAGNLIQGQTDAAGKPTLIGKLLAGTSLSNLDRPIEQKQLKAAERTATAVEKLQSQSLVPGVPGGTVGSVRASDSGSTVEQILKFGSDVTGITGGRTSGLLGTLGDFARGVTTPLGGNSLSTLFGPSTFSVSTGDGTATVGSVSKAQRAGAAIGTAGVIVGGAFGVKDGIQDGGLRGGLTALASGAGVAAALSPEPISKAILAGVAIGAGAISALLPDPRKQKDELLNDYITNNRITDQAPIVRTLGTTGRELDYNYRGEMRASGPQIVINMSGIDAKSLMDKKNELTDVVRSAFNDGHALKDDVRFAAAT